MSEEREPGILEVLSALFSEPGYKCEECNNDSAFLLVNCACSWKASICLPCFMNGDQRQKVLSVLEEHRNECDRLRKLIRISEAAHGD